MVICLNATGEIPSPRKVQNTMVTKVIESQHDNRSMTINDIVEHDVRFSSMVTGYKVYQSSRQNYVSSTAIFAAYEMLKEDKGYDLCVVLLSEPLRNLKKVKQYQKHVFKLCSLIVCIALYFLIEILGIGKVQWAYDKLVVVQIKEGL